MKNNFLFSNKLKMFKNVQISTSFSMINKLNSNISKDLESIGICLKKRIEVNEFYLLEHIPVPDLVSETIRKNSQPGSVWWLGDSSNLLRYSYTTYWKKRDAVPIPDRLIPSFILFCWLWVRKYYSCPFVLVSQPEGFLVSSNWDIYSKTVKRKTPMRFNW